MTTSVFMPAVTVHVAFNAGYSTPAASRTWTDITDYVELKDLIKIVRGRQDEMSTTEAGKVDLTLDNSDGRFTAQRAASPYSPNVKIGRPIKVTATPVGGSASIRFLGYVDEWPVEWDGTDAYAFAKITARSRQARLGFDAELRSLLEEQVEDASPAYYYPLSEPEGSTQAANALDASTPLVLVDSGFDPVFGVPSGLAETSLTAMQMTVNGRYPSVNLSSALTSNSATGILIEAFATTPAGTGFREGIISVAGPDGALLEVYTDSGDIVCIARGDLWPFLTCTAPTVYGQVAHVAGRLYTSGGQRRAELYVNGVLVDTDSAAVTVADSFTRLDLGISQGAGVSEATISNVVVNAALASIAGRAEAGLHAFDTESASDRIGHLAAFAGIPTAELALDAGTSPVSAFDVGGKTVLDAMRTVETAERGVLFDARDNTLTFHGRDRRYNTSPTFTLNAAAQEIEAGISPKLDRSTLTNDVTATAADGSTARVISQTSIDDYGIARESVEIASTNDAAYQAAAWAVGLYAEPQSRIPSLGVNALPLSLVRLTALLALDVSSKIALNNLPSQAPAASLSFFVEGYTETIGRESYEFDFNVSPTTGYDVWICGDATYGAFDEYPIG